jgi:zinc transporter ZupT
MNWLNPNALLPTVAMIGLGVIGTVLIFIPVPAANAQALGTVIGALAGAITVAGVQKLTDRPS